MELQYVRKAIDREKEAGNFNVVVILENYLRELEQEQEQEKELA